MPIAKFIDGSEVVLWTAAEVAAELGEAFQTLREIGPGKNARPSTRMAAAWPETISSYWDIWRAAPDEPKRRGGFPVPRRIDRMDRALSWFFAWVDPRVDRKLVAAFHLGASYRQIEARLGVPKSTVARRVAGVHDAIAGRLNRGDEKMLNRAGQTGRILIASPARSEKARPGTARGALRVSDA